jgi:hypothetical protein
MTDQQQRIVDYEDFIEKNIMGISKNTNLNNNQIKNLVLFPSDDIQVNEIQKLPMTIEPLRPEIE